MRKSLAILKYLNNQLCNIDITCEINQRGLYCICMTERCHLVSLHTVWPSHAPAMHLRILQSLGTKHCIIQVCQLSYSPHSLQLFQTRDKIKENVMSQLMAIPKEDFADSFQKWKKCWNKFWITRCTFKETKASLLWFGYFFH